MSERFDVFVIGGGGTGSEVAFRLAERGMRVAIAERDKLGGECNHYGCVPTKVMLRSAKIAALARDAGSFGVDVPSVSVDLSEVQRRARSVIDAQSGEGAAPFERAGIRVFLQEARLTGPHRIELSDGDVVRADRVVLTTGTEPVVPEIEGLADGPFWTNKEAIWKPSSPPGSLAVIGGGAIGIEFSQIYARFGTRVTVIESAPQILPGEDEEIAAGLVPALEREAIALRPGATIVEAHHASDGWRIRLEDGPMVEADEVLVATGRRPVFDGHDLDAAGVTLNEDGSPILTETLRTTGADVWAAGDATGDLLFTHVGEYEAAIVADDIAGRPRSRDYRVVPRVTFCDPEVASVGVTERQARDQGLDIRTSVASFAGNDRARIEGRTHGLVKVVVDAHTGELLGGHVVGEEAGAMIHELVVTMACRVSARTAGAAIHAYPTVSEAVGKALVGFGD